MRYALVSSGSVENIIVWNGEGDSFSDILTIPLGDKPCESGWAYVDGEFHEPNADLQPTDDELYDSELLILNEIYQADTYSLSLASLDVEFLGLSLIITRHIFHLAH